MFLVKLGLVASVCLNWGCSAVATYIPASALHPAAKTCFAAHTSLRAVSNAVQTDGAHTAATAAEVLGHEKGMVSPVPLRQSADVRWTRPNEIDAQEGAGATWAGIIIDRLLEIVLDLPRIEGDKVVVASGHDLESSTSIVSQTISCCHSRAAEVKEYAPFAWLFRRRDFDKLERDCLVGFRIGIIEWNVQGSANYWNAGILLAVEPVY